MTEMSHYDLLHAKTPNDLSAQVSAHLKAGFSLHGPTFTFVGAIGSVWFAQAVYRIAPASIPSDQRADQEASHGK